MALSDIVPINRKEEFLQAIADKTGAPVPVTRIEEFLKRISETPGLPAVTSDDNGDFLGVVDGEWDKVPAPSSLPPYTLADKGKVLAVGEEAITVIPEQTVVTDETGAAALADVDFSELSVNDIVMVGIYISGQGNPAPTVYNGEGLAVQGNTVITEEGIVGGMFPPNTTVTVEGICYISGSAKAQWKTDNVYVKYVWGALQMTEADAGDIFNAYNLGQLIIVCDRQSSNNISVSVRVDTDTDYIEIVFITSNAQDTLKWKFIVYENGSWAGYESATGIFVPVPPTGTGTYYLKSVNGVLSWLAN